MPKSTATTLSRRSRPTKAAPKTRGGSTPSRVARPRTVKAAPAPAAPSIDVAVESLVAWAIDEGMRTGDLDELVLDAHLDVARLDHSPEHVKVTGQRDFICEAQEEVAYGEALAVNLSGFTRQFRFLVERLPEVRPALPDTDPVSDPIELVQGWVERYRAG